MHVYTLAMGFEAYRRQIQGTDKENVGDKAMVNIFDDKALSKNDIKNLATAKSYQIVGFKELKSMEDKLRKGKKNTIKKDTYFREERPFSKSSSQRTQTDLMTKHQLLQALPHLHSSAPNSLNPINPARPRVDQYEPTQDYSRFHLKTLHESKLEGSSGVSRIKLTLQQRSQEWRKLMRNMRDNCKFPSILKSSELYRTQVQDRVKNVKTEELANLNSNRWPEILRRDASLADITRRKEIGRTFQDQGQFTARGTSKLRSEHAWIDRKQEEGCQFKKWGDQMRETGKQERK